MPVAQRNQSAGVETEVEVLRSRQRQSWPIQQQRPIPRLLRLNMGAFSSAEAMRPPGTVVRSVPLSSLRLEAERAESARFSPDRF